MGGKGAMLEAEDSVGSMLGFIAELKDEHSGKFFLYDGAPRPW